MSVLHQSTPEGVNAANASTVTLRTFRTKPRREKIHSKMHNSPSLLYFQMFGNRQKAGEFAAWQQSVVCGGGGSPKHFPKVTLEIWLIKLKVRGETVSQVLAALSKHAALLI